MGDSSETSPLRPIAIWSGRQPAFLSYFFFFFCKKNCATFEIYHLRRRMRKDAERQGAKVTLQGRLRLALLNEKPADGMEPRLKLHHS